MGRSAGVLKAGRLAIALKGGFFETSGLWAHDIPGTGATPKTTELFAQMVTDESQS